MSKTSANQDQDVEQLKEQIKDLTGELLNERITRIDFQVQLLTQWRQRCQEELNHLLTGKEGSRRIEAAHG